VEEPSTASKAAVEMLAAHCGDLACKAYGKLEGDGVIGFSKN